VVLIFTRIVSQSVQKKAKLHKEKNLYPDRFYTEAQLMASLELKKNRDMQQLPFYGTLCDINYITLINYDFNCSNNTYHIYFYHKKIQRFLFSCKMHRNHEQGFLFDHSDQAWHFTRTTYYTILATSCDWPSALLICWFFCWFIYFYLFIYLITKANAVSCDNIVSIYHLIRCSCAAWHIFLVAVYGNHFL